MNVSRRLLTSLTCVLTAFVVAACGGGGTFSSPLGPSSSSGASISGTISGSALAAPLAIGTGSFSLMEARGVTVSVAGTGISTMADNRGQFTLANVPQGTVQLNFTGPGSNATVTLTGVGPDDKVQITVTVNGTSAHVDSEHHSAPASNKREFQGLITSIDTTAKSFQIPGLTVKTTGTTVIRNGDKTMQFSDLKVGDHVEARGTTDGSILNATEVQVERDGEDGDDNDAGGAGAREVDVRGLVTGSTGTCPTVTFTIGTNKVAVTKDTVYAHTSCADATKNNARIEVKGTSASDGTITATEVELDD